jgi:hypothetical protein
MAHLKHRHRNPSKPAPDLCFHIPLSGGRSLALRLEPGKRPTPLYRLSVWSEIGMCAGGFGGTSAEVGEILLALQQLSQVIEQHGFPGVVNTFDSSRRRENLEVEEHESDGPWAA